MKKKLKDYSVKLLNLVNKIAKDNIAGASAMSCFYIIMCFFPFCLILLSLMRFMPFTQSQIVDFFSALTPETFIPVINSIINDIYNNSSFTITSITTIAALWAAGNGFTSIVISLNMIYEKENKGSWLKLRITSILYTILLMISIVFMLVIVIYDKKILNLLTTFAPNIGVIFSSILYNKSLFVFTLLTLLFTIMYIFIPNRKSNIVWELPGALVSTVSWSIFSYVYSMYVNNSQRFSVIYGSLASLIFAFFWIYFCMMFFYFGAEFNVFLQQNFMKRKHKS